jgi:hypothetical protein
MPRMMAITAAASSAAPIEAICVLSFTPCSFHPASVLRRRGSRTVLRV